MKKSPKKKNSASKKTNQSIWKKLPEIPVKIETFLDEKIIQGFATKTGLRDLQIQLPFFPKRRVTAKSRKKAKGTLENLSKRSTLQNIQKLGTDTLHRGQEYVNERLQILLQQYLDLPSRTDISDIEKQLQSIDKKIAELKNVAEKKSPVKGDATPKLADPISPPSL